MDKMTFGGYWGPRPETIDGSVGKIRTFLTRIAECHMDYENWHKKAWTLKQALKNKITYDDAFLKDLVVKSRRLNPGKIPDPELGFSLGLWNGKNENSRSLRISWGVTSKYLSNLVVLELPFSREEYTSSDDEFLLKLIMITVDIWQPDCLYIFNTQTLIDNNLRIGQPFIGLFTYTCRDDFREQIVPFAGNIIGYNGGLIIKAPEDLKKQEKLTQLLAQLFHVNIPWMEIE